MFKQSALVLATLLSFNSFGSDFISASVLPLNDNEQGSAIVVISANRGMVLSKLKVKKDIVTSDGFSYEQLSLSPKSELLIEDVKSTEISGNAIYLNIDMSKMVEDKLKVSLSDKYDNDLIKNINVTGIRELESENVDGEGMGFVNLEGNNIAIEFFDSICHSDIDKCNEKLNLEALKSENISSAYIVTYDISKHDKKLKDIVEEMKLENDRIISGGRGSLIEDKLLNNKESTNINENPYGDFKDSRLGPYHSLHGVKSM